MSRKHSEYKITGRITNLQGQPLEDLVVKAFDSDPITSDDPLGEAITDGEGRYSITFSDDALGWEFGGPDVFIRVYREDRMLGQSPVYPDQERDITINFAVDQAVAQLAQLPRTVQGTVRDAWGNVLSDLPLAVYDRDLRDEQILGRARTDSKGAYLISYEARQFRKHEKGEADLVVKAFSAEGQTIASSPVMFNAPALAVIDLVISDRVALPSLFQRIEKALAPLRGDLTVAELDEDKEHQDITFLAGETGFDKEVLARFILAHRQAQKNLPAEFWFAVLDRQVFIYAASQSLTEQLPEVQKNLLNLTATALRNSVTASIDRNDISASFREQSEKWIEEFLRVAAHHSTTEMTFVGQALDHAGVKDAGRKEEFASLFFEYQALTPELLKEAEKQKVLRPSEIADLQVSFQLADLTQADFSVVKAVKEEFEVRRPEQVRSLAKRSEQEWVDLVERKHSAGEIELPITVSNFSAEAKLPETTVFGRMLERQFREAFPTTAFVGGLERALREGESRGVKNPEQVSAFLEQNQDFDLLTTSVDEHLNKPARGNVAAFAKDESFSQQLKGLQRVFKVAPRYEASDALLADGLDSAQKIYRMGESEFVRTYKDQPGFTKESARTTWRRSADTHAAVLTIVADLKALDAGGLPKVLAGDNEALSNFPNWDNLFQTGDLCDCEQCRSVLSPAAYYADLLMFIRGRKADNPARTVKDILFDRRPDLGYLELNCDNAFTTLPYVDVVCEVLEAVVAAGENDLELPGFAAMPAGDAAARAAVEAAFTVQQIELGETFTVLQVNPANPNLWVVHGDDITYLLKKKATLNFFAEILRNTKTSAAELRAYPQYVNPKAYEKLRAAKYPMTLPFDLFAEEVRSAFQKTNLQRWDLMRTLHGAAPPNDASDGDIAAEYFGISVDPAAAFDEKRIILVASATIAAQKVAWGEPGANWLARVGNVKNFLQKTGLEYNDVLTLLDLTFINPAGDISIHHLDASCDTDQKVIQVLDAPKLDRIHRFLRLWRKLKDWKMWEIDLVIQHPAIGAGALDESFLVKLYYLNRLKVRLGTKVTPEQLCGLFGDLNTETHFTELYKKRADAHYQSLFLNKRLINPLDPAFILDTATGDLPAGDIMSAHHPVLIAALGVREADLLLLKDLTKASDGLPYINDDLNLANLSFLWRHAWLAKLLKLKIADWKLLLKVFAQDVAAFADPEAAWGFVERADQVKLSGFSVDELDWILSADALAKAAIKETDAARFLTALRTSLQGIQAEFDVNQYSIVTAVPPVDVEALTTLLTSLLQKLNRDEIAAGSFVKALQGAVTLQASVQGLPVGFVFPGPITGAPNDIPIQYDEPDGLLLFDGTMTDVQRDLLLTNPLLAAVINNASYASAVEELFQKSAAAPDTFVSAAVEIALPGVVLPAGMPSLPIRYNTTTNTLGFTGLMSNAERLALIVAGNPATAIDELFDQPRLAVKFYQPIFTAPLEEIPSVIDFQAQLSPELAAKIFYQVEQRLLTFSGIMLTTEKDELDALAPAVTPEEIDYHTAVNSLFNQPQAIVPPDSRVWLTDLDLDPTIPANDTLAKRLANAITGALAYLSATLMVDAVVQQSSAQFGLTVPVTQKLISDFLILGGDSLLTNLTGPFSASSGVVDSTSFPDTLQGWYWASRSASILKKWKITLPEWEQVLAITAGGQLLDFAMLPLTELLPVASIDQLLRSARLLRLRDTVPETEITLLELIENLQAGQYPLAADFAEAVEALNEAWLASDVESLVNVMDLVYPGDYLLAENWERLRRAFYFTDNLTANADVVKAFASATMGPTEAQTIKELLRAKFGEETWLMLCTDIQDALRERKRDALTTYLITQPQPADAPSGKWEDTNDLYAYYLLDVEMSSCMQTSRLVQGSGSIQLFVQRCFMGLEPEVVVEAGGDTGDSAWNWWEWMSKYRVWEANRKVFLWPENWIEPELKKDRSSFMKDLENELLQNDINQDTVEAAFSKYLEKLDGVAQLEIAGFFHEDDGDLAILHVFGRTRGAEPHLYYYRTFDYRQWTPWERVELDIQGDYLIPAVINKRLFLFWPVFSEVPDETADNTSKSVTFHIDKATTIDADKSRKCLRMQLAASDYRQGKWTPKRISKDYAQSYSYDVAIEKKQYVFYPIDRTEIDGRFGIKYQGNSIGSDGYSYAGLYGAFEVTGCKGVPELIRMEGYFRPAVRPETDSSGYDPAYMKWAELGPSPARIDFPQEDFTLESSLFTNLRGSVPATILNFTPWLFKMTPPWHFSYFDKLIADGLAGLGAVNNDRFFAPVGSWLPFFYNDKKRTFFVLPSLSARTGRRPEGALSTGPGIRYYYPDIKKGFRQVEDFIEGQIRTWLDTFDFATLNAAQRQQLDTDLYNAFPEEAPAPVVGGTPTAYTEFQVIQIKDLLTRWYMRFFHLWMGILSSILYLFRQYEFRNFYHPFACDFAKLVYNPLLGIPGLMSRETQLKDTGFSFSRTYQPTFWVAETGTEDYYPKEVVDFSPAGAYSCYNWELFYHAVLFIANSLSRNQRFEEAREWYHFIFNPIGTESAVPGGSPMSKYWITKPFFETTDPQYKQQRIDNILRMLAGDTTVPGYSAQAKKDLEDQVFDWRTNPFEPHRIANYRTVAYQKTAVMKYLDNLIAWGDYLFRQDSMESTNEATQLYIMAAEILGPKPKKVPPQAKPPLETFNELETKLDVFSNALVEVENLIPVMPGDGADGGDPAPLPMLYFCIPYNEKLLSYWDLVADRLYKLRHCMNIEGVVRQLSLFEPPIDPAALVKAVAGGLSISSALADLSAPLPIYRFNTLLQKANEVCGDVKALASALLSALEKKDAEGLSLLRQSQEIRLLEAMKSVRQTQIDEAKLNLEATKKAKELAEIRKKFYEAREFMSGGETAAMVLNGVSLGVHVAGTVMDILGGVLAAIPDFDIGASGFGGSPVVKVKTGGVSFSKVAELAARGLYQTSTILDKTAGIVSTVASYQRRKDDWDLQRDLAVKEIEQAEKSIAAAEVRLALAEKELENQVLQIDNSKAIDEFMRSKYTNLELYNWQIGQISGVYFQSYRLAYDLAKRAERCFRFELGAQDGSSYINFGYWDSLKKGLLSGEKLQYDLRKLETAYLEQNRREYELTKNISLSLLDPFALVKLRETGRCFISLPENIFDLDFPGHYFRRIKSVSLTLPCVVGPYTTLSCTLRLLKNSIRINTTNGDNGYPHNVDDDGLPADDSRFVENNVPVKSIAASTAQNDSGMFEVSFQDSRYLPFEGAGAVSSWLLELFNDSGEDFGKALRQFDYSTITDVILHVKYTAREDAGPFKTAAIQSLRDYLELDDTTPSFRFFDLRQEFPTQWYRFLNPTNPADGNVFELEMTSALFRLLDAGKTLKINSISLLARCSDDGVYEVVASPPLAPLPPADANTLSLAKLSQFGGLHFGQKEVSAVGIEIAPNDPQVTWQFLMSRPGGGNLQLDAVTNTMEVQDLLLILGYEWQ
jgi:receptor-binding and translocation channel-forming TcA subunit of Tc toxin/ABC toxin-like protein/neuraminidase-like protein